MYITVISLSPSDLSFEQSDHIIIQVIYHIPYCLIMCIGPSMCTGSIFVLKRQYRSLRKYLFTEPYSQSNYMALPIHSMELCTPILAPFRYFLQQTFLPQSTCSLKICDLINYLCIVYSLQIFSEFVKCASFCLKSCSRLASLYTDCNCFYILASLCLFCNCDVLLSNDIYLFYSIYFSIIYSFFY